MLTDDLSQTDRESPIQGALFESCPQNLDCQVDFTRYLKRSWTWYLVILWDTWDVWWTFTFFLGFLLVCQLRFLYRQLKKPVHFPNGSAATKSIGRAAILARIGFRNRLISSITCAALGQVLAGGGATGVKFVKKKGETPFHFDGPSESSHQGVPLVERCQLNFWIQIQK